MQASIYSNGGQESERAASLMKACGHLDEVVVYKLDKHFTDKQFRESLEMKQSIHMISIGLCSGEL